MKNAVTRSLPSSNLLPDLIDAFAQRTFERSEGMNPERFAVAFMLNAPSDEEVSVIFDRMAVLAEARIQVRGLFRIVRSHARLADLRHRLGRTYPQLDPELCLRVLAKERATPPHAMVITGYDALWTGSRLGARRRTDEDVTFQAGSAALAWSAFHMAAARSTAGQNRLAAFRLPVPALPFRPTGESV